MSTLVAEVRDARAEARAVAGAGCDACVLEPSPPAVNEGDYLADDPVAASDALDGTTVVAPVAATGDLTWAQWIEDHPERSGWAADRWLAAYRRLPPVPPHYAATRDALHRVAYHVVTPARYRATGKIGLRWTRGGFGTPFFGDDEQVRVEADQVVVQRAAHVASERMATLRATAWLVLSGDPDDGWARDLGVHDTLAAGDLDAPLAIDAAASRFLGDWFGFGVSVLEELRHDPTSEHTSRVQLWPEHFDLAFECGDERAGRRAGYGFSPGDPAHREPYVYVTLWSAEAPGSHLWDAAGFGGALLPYADVVAATDQRAAVLDWLRERRDVLAA